MGGGGTNTVQKSDPWTGLQPYLLGGVTGGREYPGLFPGALEWYMSDGPSYFPGQTVANPTAETQRAWAMAGSLASGEGDWQRQNIINKYAGNEGYLSNVANGAYLNQAQDRNNFLDDTARGKFLNANPYLDSMVDASTRDINRNFTNNVLPGVASQFALGGRYGSGAQQGVLGTVSNDYTNKISDVVTGIRGNAYNMERGFMESALARGEAAQQAAIARERGYQTNAQMALPQMAQGLDQVLRGRDMSNIDLLNRVGTDRFNYDQAYIDADKARWDYGQNLPLTKLQALGQLLQGYGGGVTTNQSGSSGGFLSNALGGAMLGNSLYGLGANAGLWGAGAGLAGLGSMGLASGAMLGGATGLAATGALGGVSAGTSLFSTAAPLMALML